MLVMLDEHEIDHDCHSHWETSSTKKVYFNKSSNLWDQLWFIRINFEMKTESCCKFNILNSTDSSYDMFLFTFFFEKWNRSWLQFKVTSSYFDIEICLFILWFKLEGVLSTLWTGLFCTMGLQVFKKINQFRLHSIKDAVFFIPFHWITKRWCLGSSLHKMALCKQYPISWWSTIIMSFPWSVE